CSIWRTKTRGLPGYESPTNACCGRFSNERVPRVRRRLCSVLRDARDVVRARASVSGAGRARPRARPRYRLREWHAYAAGGRHTLGLYGVLRHGAADRPVRFRRDDGARQVPVARGGHRAMSDIPDWAALPAGVLLIAAGLLAALGSFGLLRMPNFFA